MAKEHSKSDGANDLGIVSINNDAIATIAATAALEVRGVRKIGGSLRKKIFQVLLNRPASRGVRIDLSGTEAKLSMSIVVDYGVDIPRVSEEVQENVKRAVEKMTGLTLSEINVIVEGVCPPAFTTKTGGKNISIDRI